MGGGMGKMDWMGGQEGWVGRIAGGAGRAHPWWCPVCLHILRPTPTSNACPPHMPTSFASLTHPSIHPPTRFTAHAAPHMHGRAHEMTGHVRQAGLHWACVEWVGKAPGGGRCMDQRA